MCFERLLEMVSTILTNPFITDHELNPENPLPLLLHGRAKNTKVAGHCIKASLCIRAIKQTAV